MNSGYVGIDKDYFVSVKEVLNITAETGALETQDRVRDLLPADVVKVVRCKDCKYKYRMKTTNCTYDECLYSLSMVADNDFCSNGEKK